MAKALTREDLLYILQSIFKLSEQENNALQMLVDGLYVQDHKEHVENESIHVNNTLRELLNGFEINEQGVLLHNGEIIGITLSKKENNGLTLEADGLYVQNVTQKMTEHLENGDVHVTKEDKENWNQSLEQSKHFTLEEIKKLDIYDIKIVSRLPEPIATPGGPLEDGTVPDSIITYPSPTTLYLLINDPDCPEECTYTLYMYLQDGWKKLGITNQTLNKYALKSEIEDTINNSHSHTNKNVIEGFTESEDGKLMYKNEYIREMGISDKEDNAVQMINGKLYVKNFDKEIKSVQTGGFGKYNLYNEEINDSGTYELKDTIDNYSLILIEYYYKPDDQNSPVGCAKTAVIDTDTLNHLYTKSISYMLEYGYGMLTSNSKIRINGNKLYVDYYHNVCIYRITGVRRGENNE